MQRELPNMIAAFRASRPQAIRPDGLEGQLASEGGQTACHNRATDGARVVGGGDQNDSVCWGNRRRRLRRPSGQRPAMEENRMTGAFCQRLVVALLAASWALPLYAYDPLNRAEYLAKIKEAKAYYEDKCEKVAGIRILKGIESDILGDGSLDYDEKVLERFDFVIASVHSKLSMTEKDATQRLLTAIRNPYTTILGHPTGRLLLSREGYPLDFDAIFDACAKHRVGIEINANPHRLDLDWRYLRTARERGVRLCIGPDAHSVEGLDDVDYGLGIARKGWLQKDDLLNCMDAEELLAWRRTK